MKRFTLFLCSMLMALTGAWAETYTITFDHRTGTFYKGNTVSTGWVSKWVSNEAGKPAVTLTASANNINTDNGRMAPGSSTTCTYSISVEDGYLVTGFSMNCPTFGADVTVTPSGESAVVVATGGTLVVNSSASSFVYSGSNNGRIQASAGDSGSFTITVEDDPDYVDWTPSIDGAFLTVGDKVESISATTDPADNTKWYILTQVRGGETPMYDAGTGSSLLRAATSVTAASLNGTLASESAAYLVRFVAAENEGTYNIQFANGNWISSTLTSTNKSNAGTYAFYNCNGGSGSYFAWNINSKSGQRVDNNGPTYTVAFWGSGEVSGNSGNNVWYVYGTEVEVPASTIDVTYAQYVNGVATGVTQTETVLPNSDLNVPSSFYNGYNAIAFDYSTEGTIAEEDVTIKVNINSKSGLVSPSALSNSKKYQITCARGGLSTYTTGDNTYLASPVKTALGVAAKEFAIINYEGNNYLYSVSDEKFVTYQSAEIAPLAATVTGTSDAISFSETTNSVYLIKFDNSNSKIFNTSSSYAYGVVINGWGASSSQWDDGCQYVISEVGDFDATDALAALAVKFAGETQFAEAIAALEAIDFGTGLNQYGFTGDYAGYTNEDIENLKSAGYSESNLTLAQGLLANYALNMPATGKFYRIKGYSGNYITFNASGSNASMNGTVSANNIVYYSEDKNLVFFGGGCGLYNTSIVATGGSTLNAYDFMEGSQKGHYYVKSNASGMGTYCYDNTANGTKLDRNTNPVTSGSYQTDWTLEEVTTLPVSISAAGYATLYSPVALTIPSGVEAYTGVVEKTWLAMSMVESKIPANTAVILVGDQGSYEFETTTADDFEGDNILKGTIGGKAGVANSILTLQNIDDVVGLYTYTGETLAGFKAYMDMPGAEVKGLTFKFDNATGINGVDAAAQNGTIYNLAGQRVQKAQKGIYIVNGKKVLF